MLNENTNKAACPGGRFSNRERPLYVHSPFLTLITKASEINWADGGQNVLSLETGDGLLPKGGSCNDRRESSSPPQSSPSQPAQPRGELAPTSTGFSKDY